MRKTVFLLALAANFAFGQYKVEPAAAPPEEAKAVAANLQSNGYKIVASNGSTFAELWLAKSLPSGTKNTEEGVSLATVPHGAFLGVLRFPDKGADRRGQNLKPGVYTLRYSLHPVNGDHLGVAPQRDFAVLSPIGEDKDPAANIAYEPLMALSRKASGTPHPAVLSVFAGTGDKVPNLTKEGDHDWVLTVKIGEQPVALIVVGKAEG